MAKRRTIFLPHQYYHVYNRGAHKARIFRNDADYRFLLKHAKREAGKCEVSIIAYCLMGNHFHFLLRQDSETAIGRYMHAVFNIYSKAFNNKYGYSGTLFEGPYKVIHVKRDGYLLHVCRYIHRNPVEARLVASPEQWPYSNYAEFIGNRGNGLLDEEFCIRNFGAPAAYREFVVNYTPPPRVERHLRRYLFLR